MRALVAAFSLAFLVACNREDPVPEHGPEEKTLQVSFWDDRYEIFAEHRPIVAGAPTRFITHVTDLVSLEPRREGPALFLLKKGEVELEHIEKAPARAGIYLPELTFPSAGDWDISIKLEGHTVRLPRFAVHATKEDAEKAPEAAAPEGVSFLKEQQWKVLMKSELVAKRRLTERLQVPGVVTAPSGSRAIVAPPVAGRVFADSPLPSLGQAVEAGQILAYVQPPLSDLSAKIVEAEAESIRAKLALDQAELVLARVKRLAAENAKSGRELQEAEFALKNAQAAHEAAASLKAAYGRSGAVFVDNAPALALKAPIAGTIVSVKAALGEHVETDRPVFTIIDTAKVHVEVRIPQSDVTRIGTAPAARLDGLALNQPVFVGREIDETTRTLPIIYQIDNGEGRWRPGLAVTVYLETAHAEDAVAIPVSAIVDEDARPIAFVQVSGETFEKRDLKLGIRDGDWVQILSGIKEGERVVTKEAFAIRLSSVSSVIPAHGHAH
jgi:cobalt-zinc-cadmium efflux system membrane fusion protein